MICIFTLLNRHFSFISIPNKFLTNPLVLFCILGSTNLEGNFIRTFWFLGRKLIKENWLKADVSPRFCSKCTFLVWAEGFQFQATCHWFLWVLFFYLPEALEKIKWYITFAAYPQCSLILRTKPYDFNLMRMETGRSRDRTPHHQRHILNLVFWWAETSPSC